MLVTLGEFEPKEQVMETLGKLYHVCL